MALLTTILIWAGIALGALVGLVVLSFIVYLVWAFFNGTTPEGIEVDLEALPLVAAGDTFTIGVKVRNLLFDPRTFYSVDFDKSLLKGFTVTRLEPTPTETTSMLGTTAHHYELPIPARGQIEISLTCQATTPGEYSGDIAVFVDSKNTKSLNTTLRIAVR